MSAREFVKIAREASRIYGGWRSVDDMLAYRLLTGTHDIRRTPEKFAYRNILPAMNGRSANVGRAKSFAHRLLPGAPLPDIAIFARGNVYGLQGKHIPSKSFSRDYLQGGEWFVVKFDGFAQGRGVRIVSSDEVHQTIQDAPSGVIQSYVPNHPIFKPYLRREAVTLRLTTVWREREVQAPSAFLRFPDVAPDGGLQASVLMGVSTRTFLIHQDALIRGEGLATGDEALVEPFVGREMPHMQRFVEEALRLHEQIPQFGIVGWDFALDPSGSIWLLEMNTAFPSIFYPEMFGGPQFHGLVGHPI